MFQFLQESTPEEYRLFGEVPPKREILAEPTHKVYHDGGHYIAFRTAHDPRKGIRTREGTVYDSVFEYYFLETVKTGLRGYDQTEYIIRGLTENFGAGDYADYVEENIKRKVRNLHGRRRRFRRKAYLNDWSYFVTLTYDDKKHTADSFKRYLKKCLANLHTRRGWKYMGVFELSPNDRLHFHALVYVPPGQMIGEIIETTDYNMKHRCRKTALQNSFFLESCGRNDFEPIDEYEIEYGNTINYLLKYIGKSGERITYSRAIPTFLFCDVTDDDIAAQMIDYGLKFILFDDVITDDDPYGLEPPDD
jgi:hypothetical protein